MPEPVGGLGPRTVLVCTDCHDAWEPDLSDPNGHTGCRSCGCWTWIGEMARIRILHDPDDPEERLMSTPTITDLPDVEPAALVGVPERVERSLDRLDGEKSRAARMLAAAPKCRQLSALYEREARLWRLLSLHTPSRVYRRAAMEAHNVAQDRAREYARLARAWDELGEPSEITGRAS